MKYIKFSPVTVDGIKNYLKGIYKNLINQGDNKNILEFRNFHNYMNLPLIVSQRIWSKINHGEKYQKLSFTNYLSDLYTKPLDKQLEIVFKIFDFDDQAAFYIWSRTRYPHFQVLQQ